MSYLTVIMTHYDCARYLNAAVRSVLNQSFRDLELRLIDDASPDDSWLEAIAEFRDDPRLRIYRSALNVGPYRLKNKILDSVDSPFLAFHDADDVSREDRFEKQIAAMRDKAWDVVGASYYVIDEKDAVIGRRAMVRDCNFWRKLGKAFLMLHPTMITRTSLMRTLGGFDGQTRIAADDDFVYRALHAFKVRNLYAPLYCYRKHSRALTVDEKTGLASPDRLAYGRKIRAADKRRRGAAPGEIFFAAPNDVTFQLSKLEN